MASLAQLFESCSCGPPAASDGPSAICNLMCARRSAWQTHEMWFLQLRRGMLKTEVITWASKPTCRDMTSMDLGERSLKNSRRPLITMGPTNGQSGVNCSTLFLCIPCSSRRTICSVSNSWCMQNDLYGQDA